VEFVGKAAQRCFGSDFIKMTVSWAEPWVQGESAQSIANVQLHVKPMVRINFLAPLASLQAVLARDQVVYKIQVFHMECANDNASIQITCTKVSPSTCWALLEKGSCQSPNCSWEHPVPTLLNVSLAGDHAVQQPTSATSDPVANTASDAILSKDAPVFTPPFGNFVPDSAKNTVSNTIFNKDAPVFTPSVGTTGQPNIQLNIGAYDFVGDSDSDSDSD